ncbi:MAG: GDSL-type esterase/lipase family protein, partial [Gemmatimonadota bacterium]
MRYLALGDSYTIGDGVTESERWPHHLVALLRTRDVVIDNPLYIARTAWTTDELHDAIDEAKPRGPFDIVTLLVGVNDQYRARPLKEFSSGFAPVLQRAMGLAGKRASRVIVLSIPDWGATPFAAGRDAAAIARDIDEYNEHARTIATKAGCAWVDVTVTSRRMVSDPLLSVSDGLHPSGELYRQWAELVVPAALTALTA